jgi:membrane protease YdiL (CAAX protease family)
MLGLFWNRDERRLRALWRIVSCLIVAGCLGGLLYVCMQAATRLGAPGRFFHRPLSMFLGVVGQLAIVATAVAVTTRWIDRRPLSDFGLGWSRIFVDDFAAGLGLGGLLMVFVFVLEWTMGWVHVTGYFRSDWGRPFAVTLLAPVVVFLAVGFSEELLSRGYLLRNLSEGLRMGRIGPHAALVMGCVLSSVSFGLGHARNPGATPVSIFNIMLAGVLLSFGYMLTGRLALSIGLHISWNFAQCSVFGYAVSGMTMLRTSLIATEQTGPEIWTGGDFGPEGGLVGVLAVLVGIFVIGVWVQFRYGRAALHVALLDPPARALRAVAAEGVTAALASENVEPVADTRGGS